MPTNAVKSDRRMGPPGSDNWHAMLDGAEAVLREEGHAALTSRRIAERIGVKQRLVYYYFATMDELVIELFHRLSVRELERLRHAAASSLPLREIWNVCVNTTDARLVSQFMALAGRIEGLSKEVIHFIEESRAIQVAALADALKKLPQGNGLDPAALAIIATSVALTLTRERQLGTSAGHEAVLALFERFLSSIEPA
jgi:AcrR family transcriptional regulator